MQIIAVHMDMCACYKTCFLLKSINITILELWIFIDMVHVHVYLDTVNKKYK